LLNDEPLGHPGQVDPGETFERPAVRETPEETGIEVLVILLRCTAVTDVVRAGYRGINAYYLADPGSNTVSRMSPRNERISAVSFVDLLLICC
jgi:ADP-ribose pyrophosphatase YjhB (NUDIX family)